MIIDADAHVIETEHTWDYMDPSERKFRPRLFSSPDDKTRQYWVIDDKIRGFRARTLSEQELTEFSQQVGRNVETPQAARELDDVELRLKHMDELGIDIQVLHNTFWIEQITTRPEVETALCWSWNRWLADVSKKSKGRLRYSCVVPVMSIDEAIAQIKFAKENGAAAVCMRPLEGERHLSDPYFYPIYQTAADLDLATAGIIDGAFGSTGQRCTATSRSTSSACATPTAAHGARWAAIKCSAQSGAGITWSSESATTDALARRMPAAFAEPIERTVPTSTISQRRKSASSDSMGLRAAALGATMTSSIRSLTV